MIEQNLQPIGRVMTHITRLRRGYMIGSLAGGDSPVMTVLTYISCLSMVDGHYVTLPAWAGGMTGLARLGGDRMSGRLVGGIGAGVARGATVAGLIVREWRHKRQPQICRMTQLAAFGGLRVRL